MLFKKIIKIIFFFCLGLSLFLLLLFLALPRIVEPQVGKSLHRALASDDIAFDIQKIGVFNTVVSGIRIGSGIFIDSVNIEYDLKRLSNYPLRRVTLSGLTLHAELDENNQIEIRGVKLPGASKARNSRSDPAYLPFLPEKIVLQNVEIVLHTLKDDFLIPLDLSFSLSAEEKKIVARAICYPFGEKLNIHAGYDMEKGLEFLKIEGRSFESGHLNPLIAKKTGGVRLKGPVDFNLVSSSPQRKWDIRISQVDFERPFEISVKDMAATLFIDQQKINVGGTVAVASPELPKIPMEYDAVLDLKNGLRFDLNLKNGKTDYYELVKGSTRVNVKTPQFNARVSGTASKATGTVTLDFKQGRIENQNENQELQVAHAKISSNMDLDFSGEGNGLTSTLMVALNRVSIQSDLLESTFSAAGGSGEFFFDKNLTPSGHITLKGSRGNMTSSRFKVKASGIQFEIPVRYPGTGDKIYGTYSIPSVSYDKRYDFSTRGRILQTGSKEFQVSGGINFKAVADASARFTSVVGFEKGLQASLAFKIDPVGLTDRDIEKIIFKPLQGARIEMTASAEGKADYSRHQLNTSMQVGLRDGNIHMPDMNFTAAGINTTVTLNDLLVPESVPGQMLTIDSIEVNKVKIEDAKVRFSLEDARSLLIENIRFKWCNGLVSSESIRVPQADDAYFLTLYCDRLELTQLLKQMGVFNSEGTGTLNGRIPVIYSNGNIAFDNGFLFSTPGSGGKVMIENTEKITAGIPMDSPQFAQIDVAREALKDFDYEWAKLVFNTFEDTLYVNMELDGKPSKLLPFEYRKDLGGFVRVDASSPGSRFQGIKLDVNLNLPFNEVMKFGNKLKSILN